MSTQHPAGFNRCAFVSCLGGLAVAHLAVFVGLALLMPTFEARIALFSINLLPWQPLHDAGLPVATHGWLVLPNLLGWLWCIAAWVLIYAIAALGIMSVLQGPEQLRARMP
jgi:hypothetical protein